MKYFLTLLLVLIASFSWATDPVPNEFNGTSLNPIWTEFGTGSLSVANGFLNETPGNAFYGVKQSNISGEFDVEVRMCQPVGDGPSWEILGGQRFVSLYAIINNDNKSFAYQNFYPGDDGNNEIILGAMINGSSIPGMGRATMIPATECVCLRLKRDAANDFYMYMDSGCTGDWVELADVLTSVLRLNSAADVELVLQSWDDRAGQTYRIDYFRIYEEPVPDIKANGSDDPLLVTPSESVDISISLDPGDMAGEWADWWCILLSSYGNFPLFGFQAPLFELPETSLFSIPWPVGWYIFLFGLDDVPDGAFELDWYDYVIVVSQPAGAQLENIIPNFDDIITEKLRELIGE